MAERKFYGLLADADVRPWRSNARIGHGSRTHQRTSHARRAPTGRRCRASRSRESEVTSCVVSGRLVVRSRCSSRAEPRSSTAKPSRFDSSRASLRELARAPPRRLAREAFGARSHLEGQRALLADPETIEKACERNVRCNFAISRERTPWTQSLLTVRGPLQQDVAVQEAPMPF